VPISLLSTKLHIPPAHSGLVSRTRLLDRMNEGVKGKLILLSAPAGFGKTTLLGEWIGCLKKPVAWLSLEKEDNDPGRFWTYILAALRTVQPDLGKNTFELQFTSPQSEIDAILTPLINEIAVLPDRLLLILDDYHMIDSSSIQEGMIFLLEHMPAQLHLMVASRADPAWPLAHWRARSQLVEIRSSDLRFTPEEAGDFLKRMMKLDLSTQDINALEKRTEGWIAGLQMAALSLRGREDVQEFIKAFTGSNRYVFDYLVEEVLGRQPAEVQEFLLRTSILARLSAPLCDAVLGRTDSQDILDRLEKANLFLMPLDDVRQWYRYHHLFADLLLMQLEQTQPEQVIGLHRRAAEWCESSGLMAEAVNHTLAGKDYDRLIRLVEANAYAVAPSDLANIAAQLHTLPEESPHSRPWALIAQAWAWVQSGHLNDVVPCLQKVEEMMGEVSPYTETELKRKRGHIAAIHGYRLAQQHELPQAIKSLRESLEILPVADTATRSMVANVLGAAYRWIGCLTDGLKYGEEAVAMGRLSGNMNALVDVLGDLATHQFMQGKLKQAARTCLEAIQIAETASERLGQKAPVIGSVYIEYSLVLREWNEVKAAWEYAQEGLQLCKRWGHIPYIFQAYLELAKALQVAGESDDALCAIEEAERVASSLSPWYVERAAVFRPWQQLLTGNVSAAAHWVQTSGLNYNDRFKFEYYEQYCLLAKILLATGKLKETLALLDKLLEMANSAGAMGYAVEVLALQALALSGISDHGSIQGNMDSALPCLEQALALAKPEGFVRTFVEKGAPMATLLRHALSRHIAPAYVNKLLNAFDAETRPETVPPSGSPARPGLLPVSLIEPLSEREMEILHLLVSNLSTPEIARELYISVGTVRTHIKNIYRKLDVNRRMEAVQRARELGLI
jgi:LuxR family maltose regulon positive regulatory protein